MRLLDIPLGLLINFNVEKLTEGVSRLILPNANSPEVATSLARYRALPSLPIVAHDDLFCWRG